MLDANIMAAFARLFGSMPLTGGMQQWAVLKDAVAEGISTARAIRGADANARPSGRRGIPYGGGSYMTRVGSVAVVPVMGPLLARQNSAYWSYDEIIRDLRLAAADPTVAAILLDIDSPGGMVANVDSAASEIVAVARVKPMAAHVGGIGASAAYWIAAATGHVIAAPTSLVGSVGALIRYMDIEGIFTQLGARIVEVVAEQSPNKRLDPTSPEGMAELQAIVNGAGEMFLAGLTQSRGASRETLIENYGQGLVFTAAAAFDRGMIDGIASFEETLAKLADRGMKTSAVTAAANNGQEVLMAHDKTEGGTPAPVTVEGLRADHGELVAQVEALAAKAERDRILGIEGNALPGHEALVAEMKADGRTSPAEAAVRILAAEKAKGAERLASLRALDMAADGVRSIPSGGDGKVVATTPDEWRAEWESTPSLKAEFPTADAYVATMKKEQLK